MRTSGNRDRQWASRSVLKDDYRSRHFVPKWDGPNYEGELATARTTSLFVELVGVAA